MVNGQFITIMGVFMVTILSKLLSFFLLRYYRDLGNNYRKVVILGDDDSAREELKTYLEIRKILDINILGFLQIKNKLVN